MEYFFNRSLTLSKSFLKIQCHDYKNALSELISTHFVLPPLFYVTIYDTSALLDSTDYGRLAKCFTYVTKTITNLTTYSRKSGDYNGTIIFEIEITKNSSPLNLKFTFFATVKTKITLLFCWTHSTLSSASKCDIVNQNKRSNQKICEKVKFDKDLN
jgi:hypothetical protein